MNYLLIMAKFANLRRFETPNEGTPGADAAEAAAAKAAQDEAAALEKAKADAAAAEAAAKNSDDPRLKQLSDEKAALLSEVMDKKAKLKDADAKLKEFDGVDPAEYRKLKADQAAAAKAVAEAAGDFDRVKAMMVEEHTRELERVAAERDTERTARAADLKLIDELTIGNAFGNSEFIRDGLTISPAKARRLYGDHFERKDGQVVAYDKPAGEPNRTALVDARGEPLSFEDALTRIVDADPDKKGVLRSRAKPGAGSDTNDGKTITQKPKLAGVASIAAGLKSLGD